MKGGSSREKAVAVGKAIAEAAKKQNIALAVFDRGGYIYTGSLAALAEGAREGGLKF
jgi:large subunit ribosomal protein L18